MGPSYIYTQATMPKFIFNLIILTSILQALSISCDSPDDSKIEIEKKASEMNKFLFDQTNFGNLKYIF